MTHLAPRGRTARRGRRGRRRRPTSSKPISASSSATAAVPASVSSEPRASGSARSSASVSRTRLHRELRERRARQRLGGRCLAAAGDVHPELVSRAETRRARVEDRGCVRAVGDDGVAVHRREAPNHADDARGDLLTLDLQRDDPARPGLGDHPRVASTGSGTPSVGCPGRKLPFWSERQHVAQPRRGARDAARPDPVGERRGHERAVRRGPRRTRSRPSRSAGCRCPPFADSRPLFRMSSWICASVAADERDAAVQHDGVAPFVWPSATAS